MFTEACRKAAEFTKPLVISTRRQDGTVKTSYGSFIIINREGWAITAGHHFDSEQQYRTCIEKIKEINEINASRSSHPGSPDSRIKIDPTFLVNHSIWWGWDGVMPEKAIVNRQLDFAAVKLRGFNPSWVSEYPVFKDPSKIRPGMSICRSGYPFVGLKSEWDDERKTFRIPAIPAKEIIFPNEGMITRIRNLQRPSPNGTNMMHIETSTPGLPGQSGGPIYDRNGLICGMQFSTEFMPLGIHPTIEYQGQTVVESQFFNVGLGVHTETICSILDANGIHFDREGDESGYRIRI